MRNKVQWLLVVATTVYLVPFLLDWDGEVTKTLGGEDSKCKILLVDTALNIVYKQEYKQAAIDSEIKPVLAELSSGQK